MTEIVWEGPPDSGRGNKPAEWITQWFDALRANPRRWAKHPTAFSHSSATRAVRDTARRRGIDDSSIEVTARRRDDGKADVYVRWVGES